jgi:L,D-transpeptidase YnhG
VLMVSKTYRLFLFALSLLTCISLTTIIPISESYAQSKTGKKSKKKASQKAAEAVQNTFEAEARLIEIYKLIGQSKSREALPLAEKLTRDLPNFQLAHLVYGDLLNIQSKPILAVGDIPAALSKNNSIALSELRDESALRIKALRERPPSGAIPSQVLGLSIKNKHVLAVDTEKSRLYVLENDANGLKIIADFYISVGKSGIGKLVEGDLKTPLGVYYVTTPIDPKILTPLYGGGALPINYPNPYDTRLGKTGSGIWLHGTMPEKYSRQPKASDGCVVLANPDLHQLMATIEVKTTPVIIASQLIWVMPAQLAPEKKQFDASLDAWREAKNTGQTDRLYQFYLQDFTAFGKNLKDWWPSALQDQRAFNRKPFQWRDVTTLMWRPEVGSKNPNIMVVTYDEMTPESNQFVSKRQYWMQVGNLWKLFFEGQITL